MIEGKRLGWSDHEMEQLITRREWIWKNIPTCPCCAAEQVQLTDYHEPAQWKCRECKFRFEFEP